ncbi:RDD family protein [Novosphingobium sp.]|jgi:uncharacterized RDD family membrane protein YckC|uniref:RDD family protein n=1 Tax=Novosphingobium sp. TaxID=1874826 RepID=UPI002FE2992F
MTTLVIDDGDFELSGEVVREQARAWPRYWSRMLDVLIWNLPLGFLVGYLFPDFANSEAFQGGGAGLFNMLLIPVGMVIDAAVLASCGNTPGRALMGIRVETMWHERLDFGTALKRNFRVWFFGLAIGFPLFSLITMSRNHARVSRGDQTTWDDELSTRVYDIDCNPARVWLAALLFVGLNIGTRVYEAYELNKAVTASQTVAYDDPAENVVAPPRVEVGDPIADELVKAAAQVKSQMLDQVTRIDGAEANGRTLTYLYTITRRDGSDDAFRSFFDKSIRPNVCSNEDMRRMMKDYGITYRYVYTMPNATVPLEFKVAWADC